MIDTLWKSRIKEDCRFLHPIPLESAALLIGDAWISREKNRMIDFKDSLSKPD